MGFSSSSSDSESSSDDDCFLFFPAPFALAVFFGAGFSSSSSLESSSLLESSFLAGVFALGATGFSSSSPESSSLLESSFLAGAFAFGATGFFAAGFSSSELDSSSLLDSSFFPPFFFVFLGTAFALTSFLFFPLVISFGAFFLGAGFSSSLSLSDESESFLIPFSLRTSDLRATFLGASSSESDSELEESFTGVFTGFGVCFLVTGALKI